MAKPKCRTCNGRGWVYRLTVVNPFGVCRVLDDDGKEIKERCGSCYGAGVVPTGEYDGE